MVGRRIKHTSPWYYCLPKQCLLTVRIETTKGAKGQTQLSNMVRSAEKDSWGREGGISWKIARVGTPPKNIGLFLK